jgi:hypothetical protein
MMANQHRFKHFVRGRSQVLEMNFLKKYLMLSIMFFATLFVILSFPSAPTVLWVVLGLLGIALVAVVGNLLYALIIIEMGYYPEQPTPERRREQSDNLLQHLRAMLHVRVLRHH